MSATESNLTTWQCTRKAVLLCIISLNIGLTLTGCNDKGQADAGDSQEQAVVDANQLPPAWAKDAIWYQIFVERFYNGDTSNDPTAEDITDSYPGFVPENWAITPWTQQWYQQDAYMTEVFGKKDAKGNTIDSFESALSLRRYGGDLAGVMKKLDYLTELGINAIYFNPLNDSPSLHKFDARNWRHIDVNFGPDPEGDNALIAAEDPNDPATWVLTSADKLFLEIVKECKKRGIRVILDYSWNHTGYAFWAWQDVLKNQERSAYADWYWVRSFDDPATEEDEFSYRGWFGVYHLPELRETNYVSHDEEILPFDGDLYSEDAKQHIFAVTARWLDPNGDGDPSDGIDGYRLDVAAELPLSFWREYRKRVKSINPEAYLIGEVWWQKWPDTFINPEVYQRGDMFDAVMNYRWYRPTRQFFSGTGSRISPSQYAAQLDALRADVTEPFNYAMMNMSASHDSPRLLTSLFNDNRYKYNAKVFTDEQYRFWKPDQNTINEAKLLLAHQFTYVGAPQIWNGDEMGMWGGDDPHTRKPLIWPEFSFQPEDIEPLGRPSTRVDKVTFNQDLFAFYQRMTTLRNSHEVLRAGKFEWYKVDDDKQLLAYRRFNDRHEIIVAFNLSSQTQHMILPSRMQYTGYPVLSGQKQELRKEVAIAPNDGMILIKH